MAKSGYFFRVSPLDQHAEKLNKIIQDLIAKNIFSRVVRDAIRLYADLSDGKTDVLEELFPFVRNHYCGDRDPDETRKIIEEAIKNAMKQQYRPVQQDATIPPPPPGYPAMKPAGKLSGRKIDFTPPPSDDDEVIDKRKATGTNTGANFTNSLSGLGLFS